MKKKQFLPQLLFCLSMFCLCLNVDAQTKSVFPENAWGAYSWTQFTGLTRQNAPDAKGGPIVTWWSRLEAADGVYSFDKEIGDKLKTLEANDMYCFLIVWVAPAGEVNGDATKWLSTPQWIFNSPHSVPLVEFDERTDPLGETKTTTYPHYLNQTYINLYYRMIKALGNYLVNLPPNLRSRILYVQSAEGATGDGGPYKGNPINPLYNISNYPQWENFRLEAWKVYKEALSKNGVMQIPLLTNDDANSTMLRKWMIDELPNAIGVKNGMFSHGYQISDAQLRLRSHFALRDEVIRVGKEFYARGEQDAEYKTHGWSTKNIPQGLYWSAIYATHCGLGMWNVPTDAILDSKNVMSLRFFNKYAAQFYPQSAKGAFCAFYRGLDASNTTEFPVSVYGTAEKKNQARYLKICELYKDYGAKMEDVAAATGGGMINRSAKGYNDAGWQILTTNFQRHITQIEPETTSQAWWDVDASIYGRFARGFKTGSNAMYFNLDDKFFGNTPLNGGQEIQLSITYRDSDSGSWELQYDAVGGTMKKAISKTNSGIGTNLWKTATVTIPDAYLGNRGEKGSDFMLVNTGGTTCRFHMIEVLKTKEVALSSQAFVEDAKFLIEYDYLNNKIKVSGQNKLASIALFDLSGKKIQDHSCDDAVFVVDTDKISSGIYIILIKDYIGNYKSDKIIIK